MLPVAHGVAVAVAPLASREAEGEAVSVWGLPEAQGEGEGESVALKEPRDDRLGGRRQQRRQWHPGAWA